MLLESPWSVPLKPQLTEPWQPESQENGEHPQGSSCMVHPHLGWGVVVLVSASLEQSGFEKGNQKGQRDQLPQEESLESQDCSH